MTITTKLGRPYTDPALKRLVRLSITVTAAQAEWLRRNRNTSAEVRALVQAAQERPSGAEGHSSHVAAAQQ